MDEDVSEMTIELVSSWSLILGTDFLFFLRLSTHMCSCQCSQCYNENESNRALSLSTKIKNARNFISTPHVHLASSAET